MMLHDSGRANADDYDDAAPFTRMMMMTPLGMVTQTHTLHRLPQATRLNHQLYIYEMKLK